MGNLCCRDNSYMSETDWYACALFSIVLPDKFVPRVDLHSGIKLPIQFLLASTLVRKSKTTVDN